MQNCRNDWPDSRIAFAIAGLAGLMAWCGGCAAPGPPLAPTLNLPQVQKIYPLSAVRVGGEVRLHWTTPEQTTDKLPVKGQMTAVICRAPGSAMPAGPCVPVQRIAVAPGATDAVDVLPEILQQGPRELLQYRIELMNAAGRTAGPSAPVYAAAGAAPAAVAGFAGVMNGAGVELHWIPQQSEGVVELQRVVEPIDAAKAARKGDIVALRPEGVSGAMGQGDVVEGAPMAADQGGVIDRTVVVGRTYRYTAQRVLSVELNGHPVRLQSEPSPTLTFAVRDAFPPVPPEGLVAVPGFGVGQAGQPAIDLSWEPVLDQNVKTKVAGYKVYRREDSGGEWRLLGSVTATAYRDGTVVAGRRYTYRVTAVSTAGNESVPSGEAGETAPQVQP